MRTRVLLAVAALASAATGCGTAVQSPGTAASRPGDAISLRAERDLIFILTACSVDYPPLNNGHCGPLRIEVTSS